MSDDFYRRLNNDRFLWDTSGMRDAPITHSHSGKDSIYISYETDHRPTYEAMEDYGNKDVLRMRSEVNAAKQCAVNGDTEGFKKHIQQAWKEKESATKNYNFGAIDANDNAVRWEKEVVDQKRRQNDSGVQFYQELVDKIRTAENRMRQKETILKKVTLKDLAKIT